MIFRVDALHWIEKRGVPVMNSARAIERSVDKFYTTALLQEAGLPTPETVVCENATEAMAAVAGMGDVIIKPIFGSMGHGMVRVSDPDVAFRVVRSLEQLRVVFYVQRVVDHGGRDVRVFVLGGRVLGAIERHAPDGQWRTNVSLGGAAQPIELPRAWEEMALRAAAVVGADYAGVDLLPSRDGSMFVLEVNGIPGWQGLKQATGIDVAGAVVEHVEQLRADEERPDRATRGDTGVNSDAGSRVAPARWARRDIATAAQLACLLEVSAPKPGNVSPGRHFADIRYEDFLASAVAIGAPLGGAASRGSARPSDCRSKRRRAGRAPTRISASSCCSRRSPKRRCHRREPKTPLRAVRCATILDATTVDDAREVYAAIRLASPGGLGQADAQDVADEPTVTLLDAMRLAADRDGIAREYATAFEMTFGTGAPALDRRARAGLDVGRGDRRNVSDPARGRPRHAHCATQRG